MKTVDVRELSKLLSSGLPKSTVLIDVRTPEEYRSEHISQALNFPLDGLQGRVDELQKYQTIYVQCRSGGRSSQACTALDQLGLKHLINVDGGISAWKDAGFPVIKGKKSVSIFRQVQIVAGGMVLMGVLLSQWVNPDVVWLSGFVGAGLLFAGITDTCLLGTCLMKMPWNK